MINKGEKPEGDGSGRAVSSSIWGSQRPRGWGHQVVSSIFGGLLGIVAFFFFFFFSQLVDIKTAFFLEEEAKATFLSFKI